MSASDYLPLLAGLAAPLVVLVLVWATRRALERLRQRKMKMERLASRGPSGGRRVHFKRAAAVLGTCTVLIAAALLALEGQQGRAQTVGDSGATLPTGPVGEPRASARTENREPDRERRKPKLVAVSVINAAGIQGLAARTSTRLRRKGFKVTGTGNAPSTPEESVVWYKKGKESDARRARRALRISSQERNDRQVRASGQKAGVVIFLGSDATDSPVRQASTEPSTAPYTTR
jgi:hypothetical protein